jgi:hypothetical protein
VGTISRKVRITHPFHPQHGLSFEVICRRRHWGEDRVVYEGPNGRQCTITSAFTDVDPMDDFRLVAADRAAFRTVDLLALCDVLSRLAESTETGDA